MNVYEPLDVDVLRLRIRQLARLYEPKRQSGFVVNPIDGESAEVYWQNIGDEELVHKDLGIKLASKLRRVGYEAKTYKPTRATILVKKPQRYVAHSSEIGSTYGPFEREVDRVAESLPCFTGRAPGN